MDLQCRNRPLGTRKALKSSSPKTKDCSCQAIPPQSLSVPINEKSVLKGCLQLTATRLLSLLMYLTALESLLHLLKAFDWRALCVQRKT